MVLNHKFYIILHKNNSEHEIKISPFRYFSISPIRYFILTVSYEATNRMCP